ncbi:hypothetical protein ACJ41O_004915 [Fusarium nematophilum]
MADGHGVGAGPAPRDDEPLTDNPNGDQDAPLQPTADNGEPSQQVQGARKPPETTTQPGPPQPDQEYDQWRTDRLAHDSNWWGGRHPLPHPGDPDHQFLFARNKRMTAEEVAEAVNAFDRVAYDPQAGYNDPLRVGLRSSTPPLERAEKQIQGLEEQGVDVTPELKKEIYDNFTSNCGLIPALKEWCRDKDHVPVEHVNELLKMIARLELKFATLQRDFARERENLRNSSDDSRDGPGGGPGGGGPRDGSGDDSEGGPGDDQGQWRQKYEDLKDKYDNLKKDKTGADEELDEAGQETREVGRDTQQPAELQQENSRLQAQVDELTQQKTELERSFAGHQERALSDDDLEVISQAGDSPDSHNPQEEALKAARLATEKAERERDQYRNLHANFYHEVAKVAKTWEDANDAVDRLSDEGRDEIPENARSLLTKAAQDWQELQENYEKQRPPGLASFETGQAGSDFIQLAPSERHEERRSDTGDGSRATAGAPQPGSGSQESGSLGDSSQTEFSNESTGANEFDDFGLTSILPSSPASVVGTKQQLQEQVHDHRQKNEELTKACEKYEQDVKRLSEDNETLSRIRDEMGGELERLQRENQELEPLRARGEELENVRVILVSLKKGRETDQETVERLQRLGNDSQVNYKKPGDLIKAIKRAGMHPKGDATGNSNLEAEGGHPKADVEVGPEPTLKDRINYLNLASFLRTRNYIQLALREGSSRLANILFHDARNWMRHCEHELAAMDPSVVKLIRGSMKVLDGVRIIMTTSDGDTVSKGLEKVEEGRAQLEGEENEDLLQPLALSRQLLLWANGFNTEGGGGRKKRIKLFGCKLSYKKAVHFQVGKKDRIEELQGRFRDDEVVKANRLRVSGFHSPTSPSNWAGLS